MATLLDRAIKLMARGFDIKRKSSKPKGAIVEFMITNEETGEFETIYELSAGWYLEVAETRTAQIALFKSGLPVSQLSVAKGRNDPDFIEAINDADFIREGGTDYAIRSPDTLPPDLENPFWRLFVERHDSRIQFNAVS